MDWRQPVDGYCERLDPGLWAEPWNAVTNLAFLVAAWIVWRRLGRGTGLGPLAAILALIGIGSGLFHTVAEAWAGLADVLPILAFILAYLWYTDRIVLGLRPVAAALATLGFFPYAAFATWLLARAVPGLGGSAGYASVDLLIALHALALGRRAPRFALDLALGAALLALSIAARVADLPLCGAWPQGTHFLWHLLNALLLGHLALALNRQRLAGAGAQG